MNSLEFQKFLSEKSKIDIAIIRDYFEEYTDPFVVAEKLIEEESVPQKKLGEIYGSYINFAYVDPNTAVVSEDYLDALGFQFIMQNHALPLCKFGKAVTVATSNPLNPYLQDKLEKKLDAIVSFVFCFPADIRYYVEKNGLN